MCWRAFDPLDVELVRVREHPRVPVARARSEHHVPPAGISTPPRSVRTRAIRNCVRNGLSSRSVSSMKFGMRSRSSRTELLQVGPFAEHPQRERQQPHRGLLAAGEEVGGEQRGVVTAGVDPSGNVAVARPVRMSLRGSRRRSSMYPLKRS